MKYYLTITRRSSGDRVQTVEVIADTWTFTQQGHLLFAKDGAHVLMVNSRYWISLDMEPDVPQDSQDYEWNELGGVLPADHGYQPESPAVSTLPKMTAEPYTQGHPTHWGYPQPNDDQWF